ncbi:hypothetical protein BDA96_09G250900 [Sorghum bicolor]|uniref:Uncharacterized protein n=2 Tax=Sorghum bicolor TaxID=4558 RepID=A0A921U592_SORBI|nr:hypothetical protein BDA96_09G250900 [Sorghum bicolor]KXG22557.1 hypothetical protein SORBI_3009G237300 [Sorghum bicolor]
MVGNCSTAYPFHLHLFYSHLATPLPLLLPTPMCPHAAPPVACLMRLSPLRVLHATTAGGMTIKKKPGDMTRMLGVGVKPCQAEFFSPWFSHIVIGSDPHS